MVLAPKYSGFLERRTKEQRANWFWYQEGLGRVVASWFVQLWNFKFALIS